MEFLLYHQIYIENECLHEIKWGGVLQNFSEESKLAAKQLNEVAVFDSEKQYLAKRKVSTSGSTAFGNTSK